MQTYRMTIETETAGRRGKQTEVIRSIPEAELETFREAARVSAGVGNTQTIRVTAER